MGACDGVAACDMEHVDACVGVGAGRADMKLE